MDLRCIINECGEEADGLVMVNDNHTGLTIFMIPACTEHAQHIKTSQFTVQLNLNEDPKVTTGDSIEADCRLTYELVEIGIG